MVPKLIPIFNIQWCSVVSSGVSSSWNLYLDQFKYAEFNGGVHFLSLSLKIPFLGKFGRKNQNCQFKLKFGTKTNLNMKNSMVMFVFSIFYWKYPFLEEICSKKSKFFVEAGIQTGRIWWWFSFFFFRLEIPFLG